MLTAEQAALHTTHIGGSDAAVVLGLSKRMTARELYYVFRGELARPEPDPIDIFLGHQMEPMLVSWTLEHPARAGWKSLRDYHKTKRNRKYPFAIAHPDRLWPGRKHGWEGKTRHVLDGWGEAGTDAVPEDVALQAMHYMELFDYDAWDVAVFFLVAREFRLYTLNRDRAAGEALMSMEASFIEHVAAGTPPEWELDHPTTMELLKRVYPGTDGSSRELPEIAMSVWDTLEDARAQRKTYDELVRGCNARLLHLMECSAVGFMPDHSQLVQKRYENGRVAFYRKYYD